MAAQFFGQFLVTRQLITTAQLLQAINHQKSRNRMLGEIAVERKYLTQAQVDTAKAEQLKRDIYFGDAVISLGYLTQAQIDELLVIQKEDHMYLGDALVQLGVLTQEALGKALVAFNNEQKVATQKRIIPYAEVPNREWLEPFVEVSQKTLMRICGFHSHVGTQTILKRGSEVGLFKWSAGVAINNPWHGVFLLAAADRVAEAIAQKRSGAMGELIKPDSSMLAGGMQELVAVTCRITSSVLEPRGIKLSVGAPEPQPRAFSLRGNRGLMVGLETQVGAIQLLFTFQ